jgi:hypothetical protein
MRVRRFGRWFTAALVLAGLAVAPGTAAGEPECPDPDRLFAVDAADGHLAEVPYCGPEQGFLPATEVDGGDWRGYRDVFAARSGRTTVVYALTREGALWAFRQWAPGRPLRHPTMIGGPTDWDDYKGLVASRPGYLHGVSTADGVLRTFRHVGWPKGTTVREKAPLIEFYRYRYLTSVTPGGFAEISVGDLHGRVWREPLAGPDGLPTGTGASRGVPSGGLPAGVGSVTGTEPVLYGVEEHGHLVHLHQTVPVDWDCPQLVSAKWLVVSTSEGSYSRVVRPVRGSARPYPVPTLADLPPRGPDCGRPTAPWEWQ